MERELSRRKMAKGEIVEKCCSTIWGGTLTTWYYIPTQGVYIGKEIRIDSATSSDFWKALDEKDEIILKEKEKAIALFNEEVFMRQYVITETRRQLNDCLEGIKRSHQSIKQSEKNIRKAKANIENLSERSAKLEKILAKLEEGG